MLDILKEASVCRLAIQALPAPYIVPLNFGYAWNGGLTLYFHSAAEGRKIDLLKRNPVAGFEIDLPGELITGETACDWSMYFRSLVGYGTVSMILDPTERTTALSALMSQYGYQGQPSFDEKYLSGMAIYKLEVTEITGKRKA
jgi:nitroimidazol reductase NimA-like FMN-containing flavoprotein (pyridoxamine 5'-phosphate oxidase superfamily)